MYNLDGFLSPNVYIHCSVFKKVTICLSLMGDSTCVLVMLLKYQPNIVFLQVTLQTKLDFLKFCIKMI